MLIGGTLNWFIALEPLPAQLLEPGAQEPGVS
jgi:hypothetical protein